MPVMSCRSVLWAAALVMVLSACGGGGDDSGGGGTTGPTITLSGTATFASVPVTSTGLNYAGTVNLPIRTTVIQVRNASGTTVLYESSTDASGNWSITAPQSTAVRITVVSRLGTPSAVTARVVNNQSGDALYAVYVAHTTGTADESGIAIHAASGWTGSSYGQPRAAAPFAILDVVYRAQQLIRSADAGATFPLLTIGWSTGNTSATIGTSHFSPSTGRLSILGHEDTDTDEYDTHVVAHEWGHWFEDTFARSDSLGGPHGSLDFLDETVAFGEGFGNAFSGMVMNDPDYRDSMGPDQASIGVTLEMEADSVNDAANAGGRTYDGGWSEASVQELLWDVFDGGLGALADTDADGVSLGFTPIYQVLTGQQKTFDGFTSIYSFMQFLKAANAGSSAAITALEAAENIGTHTAYQQTTAGFARYTVVPNTGAVVTHDVDGDPLTTYNTYGSITSSGGNKLYNRMLFTATAPSAGTFRIRVTPLNLGHDVSIQVAGPSPLFKDDFYGGAEFLNVSAAAGATVVFAVASYSINPANPSGVTPFQVQFGTIGAVGKPQASPVDDQPVMPVGNG